MSNAEAEFRETGRKLRNWGRWGEDDERGTLNLITPAERVAATALVRDGKVFDLGIPLDQDGPQTGARRPNPIRLMKAAGKVPLPGPVRIADDFVTMPLQAASQWDALGHVFYDDHLYNGYPASAVDVNGLARNSIDRLGKDLFGRGVLLDIAELHGEDWLAVGTVITPEDLDAAVERQGTEVHPGDILLIRTGWRTMFVRTGSREQFMAGEPGLGLAACHWLHEHDIAALGSDNWAIEAVPGKHPDVPFAIHMVLIRDMGMTLGEMFDLDELAAACAEDGRYEFLFVGPVLKFTGGAGSPANPLAVR